MTIKASGGGNAPERLLTTREVAALFRTGPDEPARWAATGRVSGAIRKADGWRFPESVVRGLLVTGVPA